MSSVKNEGVLFELMLAGLVFLVWILILGWTSVMADLITGGDYRIIVQSIILTLAMLYFERYRKKG